MFSKINGRLGHINLRVRRIPTKVQIEKIWSLMTPYDTNLPLKRIGEDGDGGYVIPETPITPDLVISPGVGSLVSFERHFAEAGITCLMIDGTIANLPENHPNFVFIQKNLGVISNNKTISLKEISNTFRYHNAILQIDIEGGEFDAFKNVEKEDLTRFSVIVIEIHGLSRILDLDSGIKEIEDLLRKLNLEHVCVHAHANNIAGAFFYIGYRLPNLVELTFVRKEFIDFKVRKMEAKTIFDKENDKLLRPVNFPIFPE